MKKPALPWLVALASAPAWAGQAAGLDVDRLVACAEVQDVSQRLACFDREVVPFRRARTASSSPPASAPAPARPPAAQAPAAPAHVPATSQTPPAVAVPGFGKEQLPKEAAARAPEPPEEQTLQGRITSIQQTGPGAWVVSLDNGQAWRHESEYQGSYLRVGDAITISKATLGSYRLSRDSGGSKNWIRVTRVR